MRSYVIHSDLWAAANNDTVATTEENTFFSANNAWAMGSGRRYISIRSGFLSNFSVTIGVNNNTGAGATFTVQVGGSAVNQSVAIGTAAGTFEDITNTDVIAVNDSIDVLYTEQDSTVIFRSMCIRFHGDEAL